ncbi:MAG: GntR family transcriptional regulator [Candidimonas sp.]|nr:MAG: GntR family transcriptional regulator [Candidimonas sp.]
MRAVNQITYLPSAGKRNDVDGRLSQSCHGGGAMRMTDSLNPAGAAPRDESRAASKKAYDAILDLIVRQALRPGQATSVTVLSNQLGIGRTPVKEAVTRLSAENVLTVKGRRGTYVADVGEEDMRHIFALRRLFEGYAAPLAARNITAASLREMEELLEVMADESYRRPAGTRSLPQFVNSDVKFHDIIIEAAGNPYLYAQHCALHLHQQIVTYLSHSDGQDSHARQQEHENIHQALVDRDGEALRNALATHTQSVENKIVTAIHERRGQPSS